MKTVSGMFRTTNFEQCQIRSFDNVITQLGLWSQTPISGILGLTNGSTPVTTQRFSWGRMHASLPFVVLGAALPVALAGQLTSIAIADDNMFIPSQVYEVPQTGEQMLVVHTQGTIAVFKRGVGTVPPQAAISGTQLFYVGTANEEASFCPPGMNEGTSSLENLTQIFRESWSISGSAQAVDANVVYNKDKVKQQKLAMTRRMLLSIERARLFGQRAETVHNNQQLLKMEGLIPSIRNHAPQNVIAAGATTTLSELEDMTDQLFNVTIEGALSTSKLAIGGTRALRVINALGRSTGHLEFAPETSSFGMTFTSFKTRRGEINFMLHPMMDEHPMYQNALLVLEPNSYQNVHLTGREMITYDNDNMMQNCQDAMSGGILAELSLKVKVPEANGLILGLTEAACEPCKIPVTKFVACLSIDKPCHQGKLAIGSVVVVSISGAKPGIAYTLITPTGPKVVTTDASGNASFNFVLATAGTAAFAIEIASINTSEVMWKTAAVAACTVAPCEPATAVSDSPCIDQVVSTDTTPAGNNALANSGAAPHTC